MPGAFGTSIRGASDFSGTLTPGYFLRWNAGGTAFELAAMDLSAYAPLAGATFTGAISCPGTGTNSERFGAGTVASNTNAVALGYLASASNTNTTAGGKSATASNASCAAFGASASASAASSLSLGAFSSASGGADVAMGTSATSIGASALALGANSSAGHTAAIALGRGATSTVANQMVVGSATNFISQMVFASTPVTITAGSPASGAGNSLTLAGSAAVSGNTNGGDVVLTPGAKSGSGNDGNVTVSRGTATFAYSTTSSAPAIKLFTSGSGGIYQPSASVLCFSTGTSYRGSVTDSGFQVPASNSYLFQSGSVETNSFDTGLTRASAAVVKVTDGSTGTGSLIATQLAAAAPASGAGNSLTLAGSAAVSGNTNGGDVVLTGGPLSGSGVVGNVVVSVGQVKLPAGSATKPSLAHNFNNSGTGFYFASDNVGFACNTVAIGGIIPTGVVVANGLQYLFSGNAGNPLTSDAGLARSSAGVVKVTDGSTGDGSLQAGRVGIGTAPPSSGEYRLTLLGRQTIQRSSASSVVAVDFANISGQSMGTFFVAGNSNEFITGSAAGDCGFRAMGGRFIIGVAAAVDTVPSSIALEISTTGAVSCPGAGANSERFGSGSTAAGSNSSAFGKNSAAGGSNGVAIGFGASSGAGVAIGTSTTYSSGNSGVIIGVSGVGTGNYSIGIGASTSVTSGGIALGAFATAGSGQMVVGSTTQTITSLTFAATPVTIQAGAPASGAGNSVTLAGSAAVSGNTDGGNVVLTPGAGSGSGVAGVVVVAGLLQLSAASAERVIRAGTYNGEIGFGNSGGNFFYANGNTRLFNVWSSGGFAWTNSASIITGDSTVDTALLRSAAAVVRVTNGSTGNGSLICGTTDSGTTTVTNGLTIGHQSTGTPAAGLGSATLYRINSSTTADQDAGRVTAYWTDATHATRTAAVGIEVVSNAGALAEVLRVTGSGTIATGLSVTGNAAGSGVTLTVLSSGTNENLVLTPKGTTGRVSIVDNSSAAIPALVFSTGTSVGFNYFSNGWLFFGGGGVAYPIHLTSNVRLVAASQFAWTSNTTDASNASDTGLARSSAAVVRVTDGSTGTGSLIATQLAAAAPASGAGNSLTIAGSAAVSGNTNGGNVVLTPGAKSGSGADGQVMFSRNGTASAPALCWSDGTSGWYRSGYSVYVVAGGTLVGGWSSAGGIDLGTNQCGFGTSVTATRDTGLARASAGVVKITDGSTGTGSLLSSVLVEASTAGSGSPNVLAAAESGTLLTNEGATAQNYQTLPSAAAGLQFEFIVQDSDGMRIVAATGDTIRDVATVSATAGYIQSTTVGSTLTLKAINATEWIVTAKQGTWTIDS